MLVGAGCTVGTGGAGPGGGLESGCNGSQTKDVPATIHEASQIPEPPRRPESITITYYDLPMDYRST